MGKCALRVLNRLNEVQSTFEMTGVAEGSCRRAYLLSLVFLWSTGRLDNRCSAAAPATGATQEIVQIFFHYLIVSTGLVRLDLKNCRVFFT